MASVPPQFVVRCGAASSFPNDRVRSRGAVHLLTAVPQRELGPHRGSLADRQAELMNALHLLFAGI